MCCLDSVLLEISYVMLHARDDIENHCSNAKFLKVYITAQTWDFRVNPISLLSLNGFSLSGEPWRLVLLLLILSQLLAKNPDMCPFPSCLSSSGSMLSFSLIVTPVHLLAPPARCQRLSSPEDYLKSFIYLSTLRGFVCLLVCKWRKFTSNQPKGNHYGLELYWVCGIRCGWIQGPNYVIRARPPHRLCVCVCVCVCVNLSNLVLFPVACGPHSSLPQRGIEKVALVSSSPFLSGHNPKETETYPWLKKKPTLPCECKDAWQTIPPEPLEVEIKRV